MQVRTGDWLWSELHNQHCQILDVQELWGDETCRAWLPGGDAVVHIRATDLRPVAERSLACPDAVTYLAAAARIGAGVTEDILLAPIESSVIPLPHQIRALSSAVSDDHIRYLLADEVGLGKTVEAGLIMRELKLRGLVERTLVVVPKGLLTQWVAEMKTHFGEEFQLLIPSDFSALRHISREENVWRQFRQVVCPMDSVKPLDGRRGWTHEQVAQHNRERFDDLVAAGWDLIIVDEAHRLGGSTEQVARHRLGQGLAEAAPYLLFLSATPHQGKSDAFGRLMSLLDAEAFPAGGSITKDRVQPYVLRTEKRQAIDGDGNPLFKPRKTELFPVRWENRHRQQQSLYDAVTEYVREGYNQAMREKRNYVGFLMILMQRLVTSSTLAIRTTLERRLAVLQSPGEQLTLFPMYSEEEWPELDGQEQFEALLSSRLAALDNERAEVELLLSAASRCIEVSSDAKAEALLELIYRLQQEEGDPELKGLIFTEFVPTQEMLREFLSNRGFKVVCLNGSMSMEERQRVQDAFAEDARIMVSTDAGGEGLNLQFCHVVINYDIPWNPMRLEQRIGRVDRIGQTHPVRAINFVFDASVEHRVREVLEEKLAIILEEFGVDKTSDVLDSAEAERMFDDLYVGTLLHPEAVESQVHSVVDRIREQARNARESMSSWVEAEPLDPGAAQELRTHPLPHWVERMTVSHLRAHGGKAEQKRRTWELTWPDDEVWENVVFTAKEAETIATARRVTLENSRIRRLVEQIPWFVAGQPVSVVSISDLPSDVKGLWSLWRIRAHAQGSDHQSIMPLFLHDDGRTLAPTARRIWDALLSASPQITGQLREEAPTLWERAHEAAEQHGEPLYRELCQKRREQLDRERHKDEYAFSVRRSAIERIGLAAVRAHRLAELTKEEEEWRDQLAKKASASPELTALLLLRVEGQS